MKRAGAWLAAFAIALHALWPLIANARPKSVNLVPVCTVEGVTHYLEVPGGKSPLDDSSSKHHEHCSFCFLGERLALPGRFAFLSVADAGATLAPVPEQPIFITQHLSNMAARAPPGSPQVRNSTTTENHETHSDSGRHRDGAVAAERTSLVRSGVLHD